MSTSAADWSGSREVCYAPVGLSSRQVTDAGHLEGNRMPSPTTEPIEPDIDDVMLGVDPHKSSSTAVVIDRRQRRLTTIGVKVSRAGYRRLRRFAAGFPDARWAIDGARGLGAPLPRGYAPTASRSSTCRPTGPQGPDALNRSRPHVR